MTKEEQIDWLCRLRTDLNNGVIYTPWNKEFTEALTEVLEQQPCEKCEVGNPCLYCEYDFTEKKTKEPCEDCISRQALIEKATSWDKHFGDSERCVSLTDIQNAPSVTPSYNSIKTELDCVSREDAINVAIDAVDDWDGGCNITRATMISDAIKELPSVTPSHEDLKEAYINGYDYGVKDWFKAKTDKPDIKAEIIKRIEQVRDMDKNAGEYPYNRCIEIIKEVMG